MKNDLINCCPIHDSYHFMSILFIPLKGLFVHVLKVPTCMYSRRAVSKFLIQGLECVQEQYVWVCLCVFLAVYVFPGVVTLPRTVL